MAAQPGSFSDSLASATADLGFGLGSSLAGDFGPSPLTSLFRSFPVISPVTLDILGAAFDLGIDLSDPDGFFDSPEAFQQVLNDTLDLVILEAESNDDLFIGAGAVSNAASRVIADLAGIANGALDDVISGGTGAPDAASGGGASPGTMQPGQQVTDELRDIIDGGVQGALDTGSVIGDDVGLTIDGVISNTIGAQIDKAIQSGFIIEDVLQSPQDDGLRTLDNVVRSVLAGIDAAIGSGADLSQGIGNVFDSAIESVFEDFRLPDFELPGVIGDVIDSIGGGAFDLPDVIGDSVGGLLDGLLGGADTVIEQVFDDLNNVFGNIFGGVDLSVADIDIVTEPLAAAFRSAGDFIGGNVSDAIIQAASVLPGAQAAAGINAMIQGAADDAGRISDAVKQAANLTDGISVNCDQALRAIDNFQFDWPFANFIADIVKSAFMLASILARILDAQSQRCLQEWAPQNPYMILQPADAITAYFRQLITREDAIFTLRQHGYDEQRANQLLGSAQTLPDMNLLLGMMLRGLISDAEATQTLFALGFEPEWIVRIKEAAFFVPPVQDLISMAVREVFNPEQVASLTLDAEFPEDFAEQAAKQGVNRDWAEKYWQAHWQLPSAQMGFQMLHRGVIDEAELAQLLKALDVAPVWRDRVQAISFAPFTRVDIRRMHQLGILDRDAVVKAHKEIGYNDEKAELLTQFVEQLNAPDDGDDEVQLRDLTRSQIIGFFEDGVFDEATARLLLQGAGLSVTVASLFLRQSALERERDERKAETKLIIDNFKAGGIGFDAANDQLAALGLEQEELRQARVTLRRANESATRLPTKADLGKFLSAGIITDDEYLQGMRRLGFAPVWARRFLQLQQGE